MRAGPVHSTLASFDAHDCDGNEASEDAQTLLSCVKAGDTRAVSTLLASGAPPDAPRDSAGRTPLLWAADAGDAACVAALLAAGADANLADDSGATPLLNAALCGHEAAARALMAAGAHDDLRDEDGCCAVEVRPAAWAMWWPAR